MKRRATCRPFLEQPLLGRLPEQRLRLARAFSWGDGGLGKALDGARMLVEGLKTAGKSPTRETFRKVLENTADQDLGGYRYTYDANDHGATHFVDITLIGKGGKLTR